MRLDRRLTQLAARPHFQRRTIRLRLTALYGGLFLVSSAILLAITYVLVDRATGQATLSSGPSRPATSPAAPPAIGGTTLPSRRQSPQTYAHTLASALHANDLHKLFIYSAVALAIMCVISIVLGWVIAGRVLRPLRKITATAREISATNLHQRLALTGPDDELKELGDTFDDLLGRLEGFIIAQRQFVANASHELRTPLAWQRTLVQVALDDPDADMASRRITLQQVLASGAQQERLIEALLTLTRSQTGLDKREEFDLASLVDAVLVAKRGEANQQGVALHGVTASAPTIGDRRLVERLIVNLVDNAVRYNVPGGEVSVTTTVREGKAFLLVANTGPVVPEQAIERLLQPFQRLVSERTSFGEGLGLGLSIVAAISAAHGAHLSIRSQPSGGLQIDVAFSVVADHGAVGQQERVTFSEQHVDASTMEHSD